jgi:hypothetical protein
VNSDIFDLAAAPAEDGARPHRIEGIVEPRIHAATLGDTDLAIV